MRASSQHCLLKYIQVTVNLQSYISNTYHRNCWKKFDKQSREDFKNFAIHFKELKNQNVSASKICSINQLSKISNLMNDKYMLGYSVNGVEIIHELAELLISASMSDNHLHSWSTSKMSAVQNRYECHRGSSARTYICWQANIKISY